MIKYFDAFAGISGFRSAFERVGGFHCVGYCEIDRFAQKAYQELYKTGGQADETSSSAEKNFSPNQSGDLLRKPNFSRKEEYFYENIKTIDTASMPDFDLLVGGPPCQSWSIAGKRGFFEDDRGNLFLEYIKILEAKRPKYFIAENVLGLLSAAQGDCFKILLEKISELGYSVAWQVLNSADFSIPQSRKRVFIIGFFGDRCPSEILAFTGADEENSAGGKPERLIGGSQGSRVYSPDGSAITQTAGGGGVGSKTGLYLIDLNFPPTLTDKARCITTRQDSGVSKRKGEHSAVFVDLNMNPKITNTARCLHTRMDLGVTNGKHKSERSGVLIEENQSEADEPRAILNPFKENTRQNGRRIKEPNEPMFTITVTDRHGIVHKGRIRRLMPSECWRLQGFSKEQFEKVRNIGFSDAQLYKLAGNAVTVDVVEAIARNLLKFHESI